MSDPKTPGIPARTAKGGHNKLGVDEIMLKTRFNPLLRSINAIKKLKHPLVRLKYTLKIIPYFYSEARSDAGAPLSPSQSVSNATQAHKLLTALENNIKKQKKAVSENIAQGDYGQETEKGRDVAGSDPGEGLPG